jgi:hypothetical protein
VRLVSVTFSGNTVLGPTDDATTQGSVTYSGSLELTYQPRPNLTLGANGSVTAERYIGTGDIDYTFAVGAGLSWQINRFVQVDTTYRHDWLEAADASRDYHADTVRLGLTLRK